MRGAFQDLFKDLRLVGDRGDRFTDRKNGGELAHALLQLLVGVVQLAGQALAFAALVHLLEDAFHHVDHFGLARRPGQVIARAQAEGLHNIRLLALRGQQDDRDFEPLRGQRHQQVFAGEAGQVEFGDDGVRCVLQGAVDGRRAIRNHQVLVTGCAQNLAAESIADDRIIFDDEDAVTGSSHGFNHSTKLLQPVKCKAVVMPSVGIVFC